MVKVIDSTQSNIAIEARLMKHVVVPEDKTQCWIWTAATHKYGFGVFTVQLKGKISNSLFPAARVLYWLTYGDFDPSMSVMRDKCDNPLCVNPSHMKLVPPDQVSPAKYARLGPRMKQKVATNHWRSKLTEDQVRYIRSSPLSHTELAAELNVPYIVVYNIRRGHTYKSVV